MIYGYARVSTNEQDLDNQINQEKGGELNGHHFDSHYD